MMWPAQSVRIHQRAVLPERCSARHDSEDYVCGQVLGIWPQGPSNNDGLDNRVAACIMLALAVRSTGLPPLILCNELSCAGCVINSLPHNTWQRSEVPIHLCQRLQVQRS